MVLIDNEMAEMTDIEFRIWMARKLINFQEKVEIQSKGSKKNSKRIQELKDETQSKESKESSKMIQELKDWTAILRKNQTDLIELKNLLQ